LAKKELGASTRLFPVPTVLVSCIDTEGSPNIITIAWAGVVCSEPPMLSVSIRPKNRHSYHLVKATNEYVVNIPTTDQLRMTDWCGVVSGSKVKKFEEAGLTAAPATKVKPPLIAECPVNVECVVQHRLSLGAHDAFIGEVVAVHADESVLDEKGRLDMTLCKPIAFCDGGYWSLGELIGTYGFSKGKLS
jgi:flavin reductase (DIM6/NTAB) family NADH-FMN oxidoreductase RutF